ncbi:phosphotransferase [Nesterenkonia sp. K-15-9-6]|uniref:phosphotransferase n=1 Tax=Nesterenkonia sp. K-15-9-6 TaxID=3093918 RepID=UPI0040448514
MSAARTTAEPAPEDAARPLQAARGAVSPEELETPMESPEIPAGAADPDEQLAQATYRTMPVPPVKIRAPQAHEADVAVAEIAQLDQVAQLLDDAALSSWLGMPVRGRHLRVKPERSVVLAWERTDVDLTGGEPVDVDAEGPAHHGWTVISRDQDKYAKSLARAERVDQRLTVHQDEPVYRVSGSLWSDPALARELLEARQALAETAGAEVPWRVLRYNPRRRVVAVVELDGGPHVVRVTAEPAAAQLETADRWRRLGVPLEPVRPLGDRGTALLTPWWGQGDLLEHPVESAAETAGTIVAELHVRSGELGEAPDRVLDPDVAEAVHAIGLIAPWLGQRADMLAEMISPLVEEAESAELVELHGDLSPDQVLVSGEDGSRVRIIDLDRAGQGPAMRDVGSWVASCRAADHVELAEAFLRGYREITPIDEESLAAWEAYAHLRAALDPFRRREENWPQKASRRISMAERSIHG